MDSYYTETQPQYAESRVDIDENGHLTSDIMYGVQTKILDVSLTGVTLEQLAVDAKKGFVWQIPEEVKESFRHVTTLSNRANATADQREGELANGLFLEAEIISHYNDSPVRLAVDIEGLVPNCITDKGKHNWVIPSYCGEVIKESIFSPNNIFTKFMYEHNRKCDLKTLQQHIRLDIDPTKQFAYMDSKGVGWQVLTKQMAINPEFADLGLEIKEMNKHIFDQPEAQHLAKVPYEIGEGILEQIAAPLKEIQKSYFNFNKFAIRFSRADKEVWNSVSGLVKDANVFGNDQVAFEQEQKTNTPINAGFKLRVKYVLD